MSKKEKAARGGPKKSFCIRESKPELRTSQDIAAYSVFANSVIKVQESPEIGEIALRFIRDAYRKQGERAFENTKKATAYHEAGHAIIHALEGSPLEHVRIARIKSKAAFPGWYGYTRPVSRECIGTSPATSPAQDLRHARHLIAGYVAEEVFQADDLRAGSSLDERIAFLAAISNASRKLDLDPNALANEILEDVRSALRSNARAALLLAETLMSRRFVHGKWLAGILSLVVKPGAYAEAA